jgi:hypothetical protein
MQNKSPLSYRITPFVDVFNSGKILPLVEGRGCFSSKARPIKRNHKKDSYYIPKKAINKDYYPNHRSSSKYFWRGYSPRRRSWLRKRPFDQISYNINRKNFSKFKYPPHESDITSMPRSTHEIPRKPKTLFSKKRLRDNDGYIERIEPKIFSEESDEKTIETEIPSIFTNDDSVRKLIPPKRDLIMQRKNTPSLNDPNLFPKIKIFRGACVVISKFLMKHHITYSDISCLTEIEEKLFIDFVNKKKSRDYKIKELTPNSLAKLNQNWVKKLSIKNMRYLVIRILNYLKEAFRKQLYSEVRKYLKPHYKQLNERAQFLYAFYGYYFLDTQTRTSRPVETFFHPHARKNYEFKNSKLVPKHVSDLYIAKLRTSKLFMRDLEVFLLHCLPEEVQSNIITSLANIVKEWEKVYKKGSKEGLANYLNKKFSMNSRSRFPWGLQEVEQARKQLLVKFGWQIR